MIKTILKYSSYLVSAFNTLKNAIKRAYNYLFSKKDDSKYSVISKYTVTSNNGSYYYEKDLSPWNDKPVERKKPNNVEEKKVEKKHKIKNKREKKETKNKLAVKNTVIFSSACNKKISNAWDNPIKFKEGVIEDKNTKKGKVVVVSHKEERKKNSIHADPWADLKKLKI